MTVDIVFGLQCAQVSRGGEGNEEQTVKLAVVIALSKSLQVLVPLPVLVSHSVSRSG